MIMRSVTKTILLTVSLVVILCGFGYSQDKEQEHITDFWKIGDEYTYQINILGRDVGYSKGIFMGVAKHSVVGTKFLFHCETVVRLPNGEVTNKVTTDLFTQSLGYPSYYTAEYEDKGAVKNFQGVLTQEGFSFREKIDTAYREFSIGISPTTFLCDRQTIPHWNIAFFNEPDLNRDTLIFSVMIPCLETRAIMKMIHQPDSTLVVMGKKTPCKVFYSLRTDENYYITPEKHVALVTLPKQGLKYELVSIKNIPPEGEKK